MRRREHQLLEEAAGCLLAWLEGEVRVPEHVMAAARRALTMKPDELVMEDALEGAAEMVKEALCKLAGPPRSVEVEMTNPSDFEVTITPPRAPPPLATRIIIRKIGDLAEEVVACAISPGYVVEREGRWRPVRYVMVVFDAAVRKVDVSDLDYSLDELVIDELKLGLLEAASDRELAAYMLTPP